MKKWQAGNNTLYISRIKKYISFPLRIISVSFYRKLPPPQAASKLSATCFLSVSTQ